MSQVYEFDDPNKLGTILYLGAGPLVIGYSLSFGLMGFLTLQTYIYFKRFSTDPKGLKAFGKWFGVWVLFITELLVSGFTLHGFWVGATFHSLVDIIGALLTASGAVPEVLWSLQALACFTGFVSFITHGFFCWRIWCLKRSCLVPTLVMMYGLCPTLTVETESAQYVYNVYSDFEFFIPIWLGGSLVCDTIITVYMTIILRQEGAKSSFQSTKSLATKLIKLAIETGLVTTLAAVIELILATAMSQTVWHLAMWVSV
ncbi:hypothetical protein BJ138DRAFT_1101147 [Hygrophoropsis aurantiaca]|uniref:Uncharacterized protein n=1 Tax=Hygrophoropsis aurantiaca TaxID=72124 RepID=A0ACB8ACV1_9AGAM|nr:hypothetical protein BJ138DRAFT_1101147 [Hygrophoropsis aurantiaca]